MNNKLTDYVILLSLFLLNNLSGNNELLPCLTPEPSLELVQSTLDDFNEYKRENQENRETYPVHIFVAWPR